MFGPGWKNRVSLSRRADRWRLVWAELLLIGALLAPGEAWCQAAIVVPGNPIISTDQSPGQMMFGHPTAGFPAAIVVPSNPIISAGHTLPGQMMFDHPTAAFTTPWSPANVIGNAIPSHPAGTICITPKSWCAMGVPGPVHSPCSCPGLYARTSGSLG